MASVDSSNSGSTSNGGKANTEIGTDINNTVDMKKQGSCDDQSESPEKKDVAVDNKSSENRLQCTEMSMSQAEKNINKDTFNGSNLTATAASSQPDKVSPTSSRPNLQAKKRRPDKELNHDNWDQEDEPEEKGEFKKASQDQLKDRKILTARRKKPAAGTSSNPFGNLTFGTGFGVGGGNLNPASVFNFSNTAAPVPTPKFDFGLLNTEANTKGTIEALTNECVNANADSKVSSSPSTKLIKKDGESVESGADVGNNSATNV